MPTVRTHHRYTVAEYDRMIDTGILTENDRVELIRGEVVEKMSIGDLHCAVVKRLTRLFARLLGDRITLSVQDPICLDDSEPEPDVALLKPRADFYASGKPTAEDVLLVIEVADTSIEVDREVKRSLYAENGIGEYWLVNLTNRAVEVYRNPRPDGTYQDSQIVTVPQELEIVALPGTYVAVSEIFG